MDRPEFHRLAEYELNEAAQYYNLRGPWAPLAIHTDGLGLCILRKTCRMCVACDMLIVHQDELDLLLGTRLRHNESSTRRLDYLVLGTVDSKVRRRGLTGGVSLDELPRNMADFSRHMQVEQIGRGWEPAK